MSSRGALLVVLALIAATNAGPCGNDEDPDRARFWSCFARKLTATEKNVMIDLKNAFFRRSQKQLNYQWLCDQLSMPARRRQQMAAFLVQKFRSAQRAGKVNEHLASCGRTVYEV
ncbi:uncharacterized protein [Dermacentor andersoni]|uniref:uncharacterized protein n=1 Tax=Dermacentor andersoni TaxID=34620 RepID=UPI002417FB66|nr:uncharacterized protein LOC126547775 [Dermacentor andersoni]